PPPVDGVRPAHRPAGAELRPGPRDHPLDPADRRDGRRDHRGRRDLRGDAGLDPAGLIPVTGVVIPASLSWIGRTPGGQAWLRGLPTAVEEAGRRWSSELGQPY